MFLCWLFKLDKDSGDFYLNKIVVNHCKRALLRALERPPLLQLDVNCINKANDFNDATLMELIIIKEPSPKNKSSETN